VLGSGRHVQSRPIFRDSSPYQTFSPEPVLRQHVHNFFSAFILIQENKIAALARMRMTYGQLNNVRGCRCARQHGLVLAIQQRPKRLEDEALHERHRQGHVVAERARVGQGPGVESHGGDGAEVGVLVIHCS
jgi:hypothetical protein